MKARYIFTVYVAGVRFQSDLVEQNKAETLRAIFKALGIIWNELEQGG